MVFSEIIKRLVSIKIKIYDSLNFLISNIFKFFLYHKDLFPFPAKNNLNIKLPSAIESFTQLLAQPKQKDLDKLQNIKELIESGEIDMISKDKNGYTISEAAIIYGEKNLIIGLFKIGLEISKLGKDKKYLNKIFLLSVFKEQAFLLEELVLLGVNPNILDNKGNNGLHLAIFNSDIATTSELLKLGLSLSAKNHRKQMPFDLILLDSSYSDQRSFFHAIVNHRTFFSNVPFFQATNFNIYDFLKTHADTTANMRIQSYLNNESDICKAIEDEDDEKIITLIESGNVNQNKLYKKVIKEENRKMIKSFNLLSFAIETQRFDLLRKLLEYETTDIYVNLGNEFRPLDLAIKSGNLKIIKLIFDKNRKIDVNQINYLGCTLLHIAVQELFSKNLTSENGSSSPNSEKAEGRKSDIRNTIKFLVENQKAKLDIRDSKKKLAANYIIGDRQKERYVESLFERNGSVSYFLTEGGGIQLTGILSETNQKRDRFKIFNIFWQNISFINFSIEKFDQERDKIYLILEGNGERLSFNLIILQRDSGFIMSELLNFGELLSSQEKIDFLEICSKENYIEITEISSEKRTINFQHKQSSNITSSNIRAR